MTHSWHRRRLTVCRNGDELELGEPRKLLEQGEPHRLEAHPPSSMLTHQARSFVARHSEPEVASSRRAHNELSHWQRALEWFTFFLQQRRPLQQRALSSSKRSAPRPPRAPLQACPTTPPAKAFDIPARPGFSCSKRRATARRGSYARDLVVATAAATAAAAAAAAATRSQAAASARHHSARC